MNLSNYASALLIAQACLATAIGQTQINPQPAPKAKFKISEVSAGPAHCYIEVTNTGTRAGRLANVELVTSAGAFPLANIDTYLKPGEYLMLARSITAEVGISDEPAVKAQIVDTPILNAIQDTVLLRRNGTILDAMAYGRAPDTSANYASAVAGGQFINGQFVNIGAVYGEASMGRDENNSDTNSLATDWSTGGGSDAQIGSPLEKNCAIFAGEYFGMKATQDVVNQTLCNNYYLFDIHLGSYSNFQVTSTGDTPEYEKTMQATHSFQCSSADFGSNFTLSGPLVFDYTDLGGNSFGVTITGTLTAPAIGLTVAIDSTETISPSGSTSDIDVVVTGWGQSFPWSGQSSLSFTGLRGACTIANTRTSAGEFNIARTTSASSQILWSLSQGEVSSIQNTAAISRDWPAAGRSISWGGPIAPFTTETINYVSTTSFANNGDGIDMQIAGFVADYGSQFPVSNWNNASFSLLRDPATDSVNGHFEADVQYGQYLTDLSWKSVTTEENGGQRFDTTVELYQGQNLLLTRYQSVDPLPIREGWWAKTKRKARRAVGWTTRRA
ncbi:MAG: hypothetical protein ACI89X_004689, partial [Planctomycetota bacterium]